MIKFNRRDRDRSFARSCWEFHKGVRMQRPEIEGHITASEAQELLANNLNYKLTIPLLKAAYARIRFFAEKGESSMDQPFYEIYKISDTISPAIENAAIDILRLDGFTAESYTGHGGTHWNISW